MSDPLPIRSGLTGRATLTVTDADTAIALGSGDVPVLGTPRVVALAEQAACEALAGHLPDADTSVGAHLSIDHLRPTRVGGQVLASAELVAVDGRKLDFTFTVTEDTEDGPVQVARGQHRRVVLARDRLR